MLGQLLTKKKEDKHFAPESAKRSVNVSADQLAAVGLNSVVRRFKMFLSEKIDVLLTWNKVVV